MNNTHDHLMSLIDLGHLLTNAAGNLSVASDWMQEEGFLKHYQGCSAELQELSARLSSLLTDLDKLTEGDSDLLGTLLRKCEKRYSDRLKVYIQSQVHSKPISQCRIHRKPV